jgi:hypothetical protein
LSGRCIKESRWEFRNPLTATVLAIETRGADGRKEQAVMIPAMLCSYGTDTEKNFKAVSLPKSQIWMRQNYS